QPKKILWMTIQGLFHKRQQKVAADFSNLVAGEVLTDDALYEELTREQSREKITSLIKSAASDLSEKYKKHPMAAMMMLDDSRLEAMEADMVAEIEAEVFAEGGPLTAVAHKSGEIKEELNRRLSSLEPEHFEGVLRPAFQQDEWKLILTGAVLGLAAGFAQLFFLFGES
ncbi:MAG: hypothetical protein KC561_10680, partial [Myxococcales bacterium]|nr:hypothetical protein [Myxococcales bacterium]